MKSKSVLFVIHLQFRHCTFKFDRDFIRKVSEAVWCVNNLTLQCHVRIIAQNVWGKIE